MDDAQTTGSISIHVKVHKGVIIKRTDLEVYQEEVDLVVINQMLHVAPQFQHI